MQKILKLLTWPAALFIAGTLLWYERNCPGSRSLIDG